MIKLIHGDCLEQMDKLIRDGVMVDAIITDPPYGTTACKWDSVIPFPDMWERLNKLIKPNGAVVLFGSEPFSSALRMSNIKNYKYDWIWEKTQPSNVMLSKKHPLKYHEIISIFNSKIYYPQMTIDNKDNRERKGKVYEVRANVTNKKEAFVSDTHTPKLKYPKSIQAFKKNWRPQNQNHPTQKPVKLMEYLIKTYTNENEIVLDFTMGSVSTGIGCKNLGRDFIGIEKDDKYFNIAKDRINNHVIQMELPL